MKIIKRNGQEVEFNREKIARAILKANASVSGKNRVSGVEANQIALDIENGCVGTGTEPTVEHVQDMVEDKLMLAGKYQLAKNYITYRYTHQLRRQSNTTDERILSIISGTSEEAKTENSNKNPEIASVMRDYMAGEVSRDLTRRVLLPEDVVEADKEGIIHFHDSDYFAQPIHNCDLVDLEDMLQNGTVISNTKIDCPHSFSTACNIATQIIAQVASSQYGGQTITLTHLAPFVDVSRQKFLKEVTREFEETELDATLYADSIKRITEERTLSDIKKGVQTLQYQVVTLMTTNGQAPFISVNMYLNECGDNEQLRHDLALIIEEVLNQRIQGVKNEVGVWVTPAFPKLLYVLEPDNTTPESKFWYLTELAAKCTAKRMVPDYISEKKMLEYKIDANGDGQCYPCMGCRSFLTPYVDENGKPKYYGRFNQGVVTINLVDVALSSHKDEEQFWEIFDERLELCYRALMCRHNRLMGTVSDVAPILWQHGALARLKSGETIDKLLFNGYSTISLGYAGLYECIKYMTGHSHTEDEGKPLALKVMQHMNDKCKEWKAKENMDFSLYGTPIESTTYKFAKCLQKRFGIIPGITDKGYITNSYHVNVREKISAFDKLAFESEFQRLSPGGAISYVEVPNLQDNIEAVLSIILFIYDNIQYAELNTKSDYCMNCGFDGEIKIVEDDGKLVWECPSCGNRDQHKMSVARRTCGYIGTTYWSAGRTQEINERFVHVSVAKSDK